MVKLMNFENMTETVKCSLIQKIRSGNACFFYEITKQGSYRVTNIIVLKKVQEWFCHITETNQHLDLSLDSITDLLSNDELKISSEIEVFTAGDSWIKNDPEERSKFSSELIKLIRLPLLSSAAINTLLKTENSFTKCLRSKQYMENAFSDRQNKSSYTVSNNCQNRHYIQDSFYTIAVCRKYNGQIVYKLYESKGDSSTKVVDCIGTKYGTWPCKTIYNALFMNGFFYFLSDSFIKRYSILTKNWGRSIKYPAYRCSFGSCYFMGRIYILGGGGIYNNTILNSCISIDCKTFELDEIPMMSEKRKCPGCAVFCGKIIVSGGRTSFRSSKTVEAYDHCANEWSRMPDMLEGRYGHASVGIRNKLYMIAGSSQQCEVFDSFSQKFSYIKSVLPFYRQYNINTQCVKIGNNIRINIFNKNSIDVAVFDAEKEEWYEENGIKKTKDMSLDRYFFVR